MEVDLKVVFYPDQAARPVKEKQFARLKESAKFLRRTVRAVVGQYAPNSVRRRGRDGQIRKVFGVGAEPGAPPFKRSGALQQHVGYAWRTGTTMAAGVSVESYGMEVGVGQYRRIKHPHLKPTYEANRGILRSIMLGLQSPPRTGLLLPGNRRDSQKRLKLFRPTKRRVRRRRSRRTP